MPRVFGGLRRGAGWLVAASIGSAGFATAAYSQVNIPLQLLGSNPNTGTVGALYPGENPNTYWLGINVGMGGGAPQLYVFDTGSSPFMASLAPGAMPTQTLTQTASQLVYTYTSGLGYVFNQYAVPTLSFYTTSSSITPTYTLPTLSPGYTVGIVTARIGQDNASIDYFTTPGTKKGNLVYINNSGVDFYNDDDWFPNFVNKGLAPQAGAFFGTFGAGDFTTLATALNATTMMGSPTNTVLASAIGQSTASGYIVSANAPDFAIGAPQSAATAALFSQMSCNPCVTVGLSNALKAQFSSIVHWNVPAGIGANSFPNSGANSSTEYGVTFDYTFSSPGKTAVSFSGPTLLDSGTKNMNLNSNNPLLGVGGPYVNGTTGNIFAGTTVTLNGHGSSAASTSFTATDLPNNNITYEVPALYPPNTAAADSLVGIGFFLANSVMFDLAGRAIGYSPFFVTDASLSTTPSAPIVIDQTAGPLGLAGVISGAGPVTIASGGAAQLSHVNTYTGLTTINSGGQLYLAGPGSIASSLGVVDNGLFDISRVSAPAAITTLSGSGQVNLGAQTLMLTNASGNFSGSLTDGVAGGGLVLVSGTETLSGASSFTGGTLVAGGALVVSGSLTSNLGIAPTGLVMNTGTITGNVVDSGLLVGQGAIVGDLLVSGTIQSTGTPGTTPVTGTVGFLPGSVYQVAIGAAGVSDRIVASGSATLGGGTVLVFPASGFAGRFGTYTILTAAGGLSGQFSGVTTPFGTSYFPFLGASLDYTANDAQLSIGRGANFTTVAQTANQAAAGAALDNLSLSNGLLQAMALLNYQTAPAALSALSGDIYGSTITVMQQESAYLRDTLGARLRQVLAPAESPQFAALGPTPIPVMPGSPITMWQQALGAWGSNADTGNAAGISRSTAGFVMGVDAPFDNGWRAGLASGFDQDWFNSTGTAASGSMIGAHLAAYAGRRFGELTINFGASNTWYSGTVTRSVAFPGFVDTDKGGISATTTQAFTEIAWDQPLPEILPGALVQPFANLAYAHVNDGVFNESGGPAALSAPGSTDDNFYTSFGARGSLPVSVGGWDLKANGLVGWQHAFGITTPDVALAFAGGAAPFTAQGVPLARDAALIGAGLRYDASPTLSFALGYTGRLAAGVQDHQMNGTLTIRF